MDILVAIVILVILVWFTKSLILALIYIAAACFVVYMIRATNRKL